MKMIGKQAVRIGAAHRRHVFDVSPQEIIVIVFTPEQLLPSIGSVEQMVIGAGCVFGVFHVGLDILVASLLVGFLGGGIYEILNKV